MLLAIIAGGIGTLSSVTPAQSQERTVMASDTLGASARQAMIDVFRNKDVTAVDPYFAEPFVQHDPSLADGLAGVKAFAGEVASSPAADITIYRTLVDGDFVLLHSKYQGVARYAGSAIAFDLFRFKDGKIVEHWGGQEPEEPPNLSGRTQVDGPTAVLDREKTEANRALVRNYRETVMVALRFGRIEEFIEGAHYAQHASKIGDGIARLRERIGSALAGQQSRRRTAVGGLTAGRCPRCGAGSGRLDIGGRSPQVAARARSPMRFPRRGGQFRSRAESRASPRRAGSSISRPAASWLRATLSWCCRRAISPPDRLRSTICSGSRTERSPSTGTC
jgi:predicted SnoaL-like aldol condensation-catalyzing enzyme